MKEFKVGKLHVKILKDRPELGKVGAADAAEAILKVIAEKGNVNIIFASAPSQNEFLYELANDPRIDWNKVHAFNMDEYVGIDPEHPAGFGKFLRDRIYDKVRPGKVELMNTLAEDPQAECDRYAALLKEYPADICFYGIGESCHLAFNDPKDADFNDPKTVKLVQMEFTSIQQQVNDGCFEKIEEVPRQAYTLTIPTLMRVPVMFGMVPGKTKVHSIYRTLTEEISTKCPSTALREHDNAWLYIDEDSAAELSTEMIEG